MRSSFLRSLSSAAVVVLASQPVLSHGPGGVSVDIKPVAESVAKRMGINAAEMPLSILAPADVAAAACGVTRDAVTPNGNPDAGSCTASNPVPQIDAILTRMRLVDSTGAQTNSAASVAPVPTTPPAAGSKR